MGKKRNVIFGRKESNRFYSIERRLPNGGYQQVNTFYFLDSQIASFRIRTSSPYKISIR